MRMSVYYLLRRVTLVRVLDLDQALSLLSNWVVVGLLR